MVSTRRSGSIPGNNSKRSSSGEDRPSSPKRQKVENGAGASEKPPPDEDSKELCTPPPVDPGECGAGDTPIAGDGVKGESSPAMVAVAPPFADGSIPILPEKPTSFSVWSMYETPTPWCRLLSQSAQNPSIAVCSSSFSIGSSRQCNFPLKDQTISGVLCKIRHTQREGSAVAVLESVGSKGSVQVNGTVVSKSASCVLNSGDEVVFGLLGNHAYIFHQLVTDVSVKGAEIHNSLGKYMQLERRTGDPSAVAGASILASLSSLGHDLARWKLPSQSTSKINQATEVPTNSAVQNGMEIGADGTDGNSAANIGSDKAADSGATNKNLQLDNNQDPGIEAGNVKLSGVNDLLRPFLRMFAPSTSCNLKLSKSICKQVFDERIERTRDSQPPSTSGMPSRCTVFREEIRGGILDGRDLEVSFDNFPYYLSEHTKNVLIASSYIHLKHKELVNYASDLAAINPRILLSGPAGSEIYQEMLAKALANHFGAKLLIFDSHSFLGGLSSKEAELLKDGHNLDKSYNRIRQEYLAKFADRLVGEGEIPSSSVVPCSGSESQPKMETDPAPSLLGLHKFHMFKIGDRVKFMGSSGSLYPTTSPQRGGSPEEG